PGCGKTTALRMVAGLDEPTSGAVVIGGRIVNGVPPQDRDVAMVFQNYALYPHQTVRQNLAFGLKQRKVAKEVVRERVAEVSSLLALDELLDRKPAQLSGGQRQRVAMGRALARSPPTNLPRAVASDGRIDAGDFRATVEGTPNGPVVVGIRPESFHLSDGGEHEPTVEVRVEVVELLGHETILYGSVRGERAVAVGADAGLPPLPSERATIIARLDAKRQPSVGDTVSLAFSREDLRLFGGPTGDALPS